MGQPDAATVFDDRPIVAVAHRLVGSVKRGELDTVWLDVGHPAFRLACAQWFLSQTEPELVGDDLAARAIAAAAHPRFGSCMAWLTAKWQAAWAEIGLERRWRGYLEHRPRPPVEAIDALLRGPDPILVTLVAGAVPVDRALPELTLQFPVALDADGRWHVAGIGRFLAVPGWPPTRVPIWADGTGT